MSIVRELMRRNVFRVAFAYVVVAWLVLQVGDTLGPALNLPPWVNTALAFFLILGFPVALLFAWAYELTPEGIKKEKDVDRSQSITHLTGRKIDYVIIAVLALALGYFAFDKFVLDPVRHPATNDKSIAVLAFADMSPEGDQEYFCDGISEELLNALARIPGLRVPSRNSSFQFKGENLDIIDVGKQLNVALVLEGSVRKAGDTIRITAQLIDARTDEHLWSDTYDRQLEDIFAIQDEISAAIVTALREHLRLQVEAVPRVTGTANTAAHDAFLRGRDLVVRRGQTNVEGAVREFETALALDPDYALAHAELAIAYLLMTRGGQGNLTRSEAMIKAAPHAKQAMELDPSLAEAHAAAGFILWRQGHYEKVLPHFDEAIRINPNYAIAYTWKGVVLHDGLGRYKEGLALGETTLELDPLSLPTIGNNVLALIRRNQLAEAARENEKLRSARPAWYASYLGMMKPAREWAGKALAQLDSIRIDPSRANSRERLSLFFAVFGLEQEALAISDRPLPLTSNILGRPSDAVSVAEQRVGEDPDSSALRQRRVLALASAGEYERARPILEELWRKSGGRVTYSGQFWPSSAIALIAIRQDSGDEDDIDELVAAIKDNERRMREAGYVRFFVHSIDFYIIDGIATWLAGEHDRGLELIANAVEDGAFVLPTESYLQSLYDDPGFAPIRVRQEAHQASERKKFLDVVCNDNPYAEVWQPADGTCESFAEPNSN